MLNLFKNIFGEIKRVIISNYKLSLLQSRYPSCKFHLGCMISNTAFERFNIVFGDVIIDSCTIGAHTYIQKKSNIFNAEIGRFCSIASGVTIAPGVHKTSGVSTHPVFFIKNTPLICKFAEEDAYQTSKKVNIGNDVWIGEKAIVMDGITIGSGAIIAAGAVVTKDVAPYSIVGGVPAKFIKYRFNEITISKLLESKWWDNSDNWLKANHKLFIDPELFLNKENINELF